MKKMLSIWIMIIGLFILSGCVEKESPILGIKFLGSEVIDFHIGEDSINDFEIELSYEDKTTEVLSVTDIMVDQLDVFDQAGYEDITITYKDLSTKVTFKIYETDFDKQTLDIYEMAVNANAIDLTYDVWLESIKGEAGINGLNGVDGVDGIDGIDGIDGTNGIDGVDGIDGVNGIGIASTTINELGHLIITFTNLSTVDVGKVVGYQEDINFNTVVVYDYTNTFVQGVYVVMNGSSLELSDPVLPNGYQFNYWSISLSNINTDKSVYPVVTASRITVVYHNYLNTTSLSQNMDSGQVIPSGLPTPVREGYVFLGWFTGLTANDPQVFNNTVMYDDIDLYERWELEVYSLVFMSLGGSHINSEVYLYNSLVDELPTPVREGYVFNGWFTDVNNTTVFDESAPITGNVVLYPQWVQLTYQVIDGSYVNITKHTDGVYKDLIIPSMIDGYPVTHIDSSAFKNSNLETIVIPESVTNLGDRVFESSYALKEVMMSDNITSMGTAVFYYCLSLETIHLPSNLTTIPKDTFLNNTSLVSIVIPEGVTSIGDYAFMFSGLTSLNLPSSMEVIGVQSFAQTHLSSVVLNEGLLEMKVYSFQDIDELTSIILPSTLVTYNLALSELYNLNSLTVEAGNMNFSAIQNVLYNIDQTQIIYYPESLQATEFTIHSTVTSLAARAFTMNAYLETVHVPDTLNVYSFSNNFDGYSSLKEFVVYDNSGSNFTTINGVIYDLSGTTLIKYPIGKTDTSFTVPSHVTIIGSGAFEGATNLTEIILQEGIVEIRSNAFKYTLLPSLILPSTVTTLGVSAFSEMDALLAIEIPSGVEKLSGSAFYGCDVLTSVTLNEGLLEIGDRAFMYAPITSLHIPASVTTISGTAFHTARAIETVTIAAGNLNFSTDGSGAIFNADQTIMTHYLLNAQSPSYTIPETVLVVSVDEWINTYLETLIVGSNVTSFIDASSVNLPNLDSVTFLNDTSGAITEIGGDYFAGMASDAIIYVKASVLNEYEASTYFNLHTDSIEAIVED